jgi:uncharacterized protein (TIGR03067 family)
MNRLIPIFIAVFVGVFGCSYLFLQMGGKATSPGEKVAARPPSDDDSADAGPETKPVEVTPAAVPPSSEFENNKPQNAKSADDVTAKLKEVEKQLRKPDDFTAKLKEAQKQLGKSGESPIPVAKPASKSDRSKRIVVKKAPATPQPAEPDAGGSDDDLSLLQGTWRMVDTEYDGSRLTEEAQKHTWEFQGNKYTIKNQGNFLELWKAQLNSSRNPKTIDGTHDITGGKLKGIYEVTADSLKVCYDLTGKGRPDSFKAGKGSRRVCYYFKRS